MVILGYLMTKLFVFVVKLENRICMLYIIHKHKEPFIYRELYRHKIMERVQIIN